MRTQPETRARSSQEAGKRALNLWGSKGNQACTYIYITQWKLGGMIAPSGGCSPGGYVSAGHRQARTAFCPGGERARALAAAPLQASRAPVVLLEHAAEPRDEIEVESHLEEENTRGKHEPAAQGLVRAPP